MAAATASNGTLPFFAAPRLLRCGLACTNIMVLIASEHGPLLNESVMTCSLHLPE